MTQGKSNTSAILSTRQFSFWAAVVISVGCVAVLYWDIHNPNSKLKTNHLILIGLAILPWAGNFISSLKLSASGIEADFNKLEQDFETVLNLQGEPDIDETPTVPTSISDLDDLEKSVLKALNDSRYSLRSWSGIRDDTSLKNRKETVDLLLGLEKKDLVNSVVGPKSGKILWSITPAGRQAHSNKDE